MVIVDGDKVQRTPVSIGARLPGVVEIRGGVTAGDLVITHGNDKVRPGQPVAIRIDDGSRPLRDMLGPAG
jgi:membrane fusion protein (multidrug efflux system)